MLYLYISFPLTHRSKLFKQELETDDPCVSVAFVFGHAPVQQVLLHGGFGCSWNNAHVQRQRVRCHDAVVVPLKMPTKTHQY